MMQGWKTYDCSDLEQHGLFLEELSLSAPSDLTAQQVSGPPSPPDTCRTDTLRESPVRSNREHLEDRERMVVEPCHLDAGLGKYPVRSGWRVQGYPIAITLSCVRQHRPTPFETTADDELFLAIDPDCLKTFCADLLGRPVQGPIRFAPDLSPNSPHGRALRTAANLGLGNTEFPPNGVSRSRFDAQLQEFVATTLLMHHPHNLRDRLCGRAPLPASRDVENALDYIHSRLTETISLEDHNRDFKCAGRTLNEHFRLFLGISPMAYVSVSASNWPRKLTRQFDRDGSGNKLWLFPLGQFSVEYASAFGEKPSMTREASAEDFDPAGLPEACRTPGRRGRSGNDAGDIQGDRIPVSLTI